MRIGLAFRVFFKILFDAVLAGRVSGLLAGSADAEPQDEPKRKTAPKAKSAAAKPARSDAITLLATLQREARFVDLVKEQLGDYSDEQVGAAARDVLRDCGSVLDRMFDLQPLTAEEEGAELETPADVDAMRYRLTGNVSGDPPFRGSLVHPGWEAKQCEVPVWSGSEQSARVVAPIEIEL